MYPPSGAWSHVVQTWLPLLAPVPMWIRIGKSKSPHIKQDNSDLTFPSSNYVRTVHVSSPGDVVLKKTDIFLAFTNYLVRCSRSGRGLVRIEFICI